MLYEATITCPYCGASKKEPMPERTCETRYICASCKKTLVPRDGECCVFCSFSDTICPPTQEKRNCCSD